MKFDEGLCWWFLGVAMGIGVTLATISYTRGWVNPLEDPSTPYKQTISIGTPLCLDHQSIDLLISSVNTKDKLMFDHLVSSGKCGATKIDGLPVSVLENFDIYVKVRAWNPGMPSQYQDVYMILEDVVVK